MNRKEISYLMAIIKTAYPHYYQKTSDIEDALSLWGEMFIDDDPPSTISKAVKGLTEMIPAFPPAILNKSPNCQGAKESNARRRTTWKWWITKKAYINLITKKN